MSHNNVATSRDGGEEENRLISQGVKETRIWMLGLEPGRRVNGRGLSLSLGRRKSSGDDGGDGPTAT